MTKKYVPPPITTGLGQVVNNKRAQQQRNFAMQPTQAQNPVPGNSDSIFEKISKTVVGGMLNMVNTGLTASGDRPAVTPGDAGVRQTGQGVSYLNNTLNPYSDTTNKLLGLAAGKPDAANELIKSASVDAALTAAAFGAGKVVQKGSQLIKQGIKDGTYVNPSAAIQNIKEGNKIVIHSSPTAGLPELKPHFGSMAMPNENVLFSWNPRVGRSDGGLGHSVIDRNIINYTHPRGTTGGTRPPGEAPGSVYVAKVPLDKTGAVRKRGNPVAYQNRMVVTNGPGEIIKEIPSPDISNGMTAAKNYSQFRDELARELRKSGVLPKDIPTSRPSLSNRLVDKMDSVVDSVADSVMGTFKKTTRR